MHPSLKQLIFHYVAVLAAALEPVLIVSSLSIPFNLRGHPGEISTTAPQSTHFS